MNGKSKRIWLLAVALYAILGVVVWNCETLRKSRFSIEEAKKQAEENKKKIAARKAAEQGQDKKKEEVIPPKEIEKIGKNLAKKKAKQIEKQLKEVDETIEQIDKRTEELTKEYREKRSAKDEMLARIAAVARGMQRFDRDNHHVRDMVDRGAELVREARDGNEKRRLELLQRIDERNRKYGEENLPYVRPAVCQGRLTWLHKEMSRLLAAALKKEYETAKEFPTVPLATVEAPDSDHPDDQEQYLKDKEDELDTKYAAMKVL